MQRVGTACCCSLAWRKCVAGHEGAHGRAFPKACAAMIAARSGERRKRRMTNAA
jgi:hypothetical protein